MLFISVNTSKSLVLQMLAKICFLSKDIFSNVISSLGKIFVPLNIFVKHSYKIVALDLVSSIKLGSKKIL